MLSIFLLRNTGSTLKDAAAAAPRRPGEEADRGSLVTGRVIGPQSIKVQVAAFPSWKWGALGYRNGQQGQKEDGNNLSHGNL